MGSHLYLTVASSLCIAIISMAFVVVYDLYLEINSMENEVIDGMVEFRVVINDAWKEIHSTSKNSTPNIFASFSRNKRALKRCRCCDHSGQFCPKGPRGVNGEPGSNGDDGRPGPPGSAGISALRLWCPVQTDCVRCPRGQPGHPGKNGNPGPPGQDGQPGKDGHPGRNSIQGPLGPPGDPGPPGKPGLDGHPGQPGSDGQRTIRRRGPRGDQGIEGLPGFRGEYGKTGPRGNEGPAGFPGEIGEPGRDGLDGRPGLDGKPGRRGLDRGTCDCPRTKEAQNATVFNEVKFRNKETDVKKNIQTLPNDILDKAEDKNSKTNENVEGEFVQ